MIAVERQGPVRAFPIEDEKVSTMKPLVEKLIAKATHLMTDGHRSYQQIGREYVAHSQVIHSKGEYSRGMIHCNTAESFASLFERGRVGVFHCMSRDHMQRYLNEFAFRWDNREPTLQKTRKGEVKEVMRPIPIVEMLRNLILRCQGSQLKRTKHWGIVDLTFASP